MFIPDFCYPLQGSGLPWSFHQPVGEREVDPGEASVWQLGPL